MAIVKMKKVSMVILNSDKENSLKQLRKAGVLHLEAIEGNSVELTAFRESSAETDKAVSIIDEVKVDKKTKISQVKLDKEEAKLKAKQIVEFSERKKSLYDAINSNTQELARFEKWGKVDPAQLEAFAEKGIYLYLYEIPAEKYSLIAEDCKTILVNTINKTARFVHVSETPVEERPEGIPAEAFAVPLPEVSTDKLLENNRLSRQEIEHIDKEIFDSKKYRDALLAYKKSLLVDIEFENVYSGMETDATENVEAKLAWLTGYVPVDSMETFKKVCAENGWAYVASDPCEDDPVPTKLKNNPIVRLIYPLTSFLDVTPGYNEYDISSWFLLFFCLFFAMIFGDGGYGALITLAGIALLFKRGISKSLGAFVTLLGLCTIGWGAATCTWFGMAAEKLPSSLVDLSIAPISAAKVGSDVANTNQKIFCFVLAIIQLSVAHIKGIFRNIRGPKALGDLGALLQLWGMFYVVMNMVVDAFKYPLGITPQTIYVASVPLSYIALGVLGIGFALNFTFANYNGSVKDSVLESCKNIISVLLGIVNVFSDIVSYIRLWAVALAGAAISNTVNTMAGPMFGKLYLLIFGVVLLCFGHGLNMILNLLSVIVHGVRLNTLEFSQHLGMSWSGTKYSPFSEK
ncbi:MAG: ATPase [Treponema sp.]|nr:ATPase [Treponema sp.]